MCRVEQNNFYMHLGVVGGKVLAILDRERGWSCLLCTEIGIGMAAGKVGNPHMWFQRDDAITHCMRVVWNLDTSFHDCWLGLGIHYLATAFPLPGPR